MKKNNRKRLKSLPRSRQGWVLLHPMVPMVISECLALMKRYEEIARRYREKALLYNKAHLQ